MSRDTYDLGVEDDDDDNDNDDDERKKGVSIRHLSEIEFLFLTSFVPSYWLLPSYLNPACKNPHDGLQTAPKSVSKYLPST